MYNVSFYQNNKLVYTCLCNTPEQVDCETRNAIDTVKSITKSGKNITVKIKKGE
jgi:hypothetical protein